MKPRMPMIPHETLGSANNPMSCRIACSCLSDYSSYQLTHMYASRYNMFHSFHYTNETCPLPQPLYFMHILSQSVLTASPKELLHEDFD